MSRLTNIQVGLKKQLLSLNLVLLNLAGVNNDSEYKIMHDGRNKFDTEEDFLEYAKGILTTLVMQVFSSFEQANINDIKRVKKAVLK